MTIKEIKLKVDDIIKDEFCLDELDEYNSDMELYSDLGADEINLECLLASFESEFDISIPNGEISINSTINDIYNVVICK